MYLNWGTSNKHIKQTCCYIGCILGENVESIHQPADKQHFHFAVFLAILDSPEILEMQRQIDKPPFYITNITPKIT